MKRQRGFWDVGDGEKEAIERRIEKLGDDIAELDREEAVLKRVLKPYWLKKESVENAIRRTFRTVPPGTIVHSLDGAEVRRPLYADLLALAERGGKTREEQRLVSAALTSRLKEYRKLKTELKYILRKEGTDHGR